MTPSAPHPVGHHRVGGRAQEQVAVGQHRGDRHPPPLRSTHPGCLAVTWPYAPEPGTGSTEEVLATFSGEVADRHPPTGPTTDEAGVEHPGKEGVRLLTWGDPYLTAWLEAVRGGPLAGADSLAAGLAPGSNPMRQTRRERS
jgi:hypothetical protein